ncbi:MAG TPA: hypothetical protein PKE58_05595 [Acidobacteriota bacterium]|nr:hypothetical protein [Acidobacteriota bacterium]
MVTGSKKTKFSCGLYLFIFFWFSSPIWGQIPEKGVPTTNSTEVLDAILYPDGAEYRQLTLLKISRPKPSYQEVLSVIQRSQSASRNQPSTGTSTAVKRKFDPWGFESEFANTMFMVVESPVGNPKEIKQGQVIGLLYGDFDDMTYPLARWSGKLVWDQSHKEGYVVLAKNTAYTTLGVGKFNPKFKISDYPVKSENTEPGKSLLPAGFLSQVTQLTIVVEGGIMGFTRVNALIDQKSIIIQGEDPECTCGHAFLRLNLETKAWTQVFPTEKAVKSEDYINSR